MMNESNESIINQSQSSQSIINLHPITFYELLLLHVEARTVHYWQDDDLLRVSQRHNDKRHHIKTHYYLFCILKRIRPINSIYGTMFRIVFFLFLATIELATAFSSVGNSSAGPTGSSLDDAPDPSSQPEVVARDFVEITKFNDNGRKESLPASFIERWPNWFLGTDGSLSRIPDEETGGGTGFVTATSTDTLYQPVDLKRPEMKLAVGVHVRSGQIRHVMPALDISYGDGLHRNRGLCSVPLAYNWVDFGFINSMGDYNRYQLRVSSKKRVGEDEDDDEEWDQLSFLPGNEISKAIERAIVCLAEVDSDDLGSGSHIIHVALDGETLQLPRAKNELQVTMVEIGHEDEGEEDVDVGILQVAIITTMSGSESQYLPEAYKPLYGDESLRNPKYAQFKKRQEERKEEEERERKQEL